MTPKEINQSIEKQKIRLSKVEKIKHWINFIHLTIPLGLFGFDFVYKPIKNGEISVFGIFVMIVFFLFLRHKLVCSKLDVYKTDLTEEQFKQANQAAAILNDWEVLSNKKDIFSAIKRTKWQWDGIKITAILKNGRIYLNSMVKPSIRSNPFTFKMNRKNKSELIRQYQLILKGENVVENAGKEIEKRKQEFWEESELTLKNILKRFVGYGISLPIIALGVYMISTGELVLIAGGIIAILLCSSYIYLDIKVIREKWKRKKEARKQTKAKSFHSHQKPARQFNPNIQLDPKIMTFKYSICHPDKKDIEYRNSPISQNEVTEIAKNYPWIEKLKLLDSLKQEEIYYNPSLDFNCIETGKSFCLTANFDETKNLEFSLWYSRPKKVKVLFGLFGEKTRVVVDEKFSVSFDQSLKYLDYFVNGNYSLIESLYKKF